MKTQITKKSAIRGFIIMLLTIAAVVGIGFILNYFNGGFN